MQRMTVLSSRFPSDHMHVTDLPYRLSSWALDDPENAGLWFDTSGELAGWAVMQFPFWTIDDRCAPADTAGLLLLMLDWALAGSPLRSLTSPRRSACWT